MTLSSDVAVPFTAPNCVIPDAEHLYGQLLAALRPAFEGQAAPPVLIGIHRGGVWLAERLARDLGVAQIGTLDISFYRDDFAQQGIKTGVKTTSIPFAIENSTVIVCDDVLMSGRSTRAALNEIFEFGRPASVALAVLFDRGGRQLPIYAQFTGGVGAFDPAFKLILERDEQGRFCFRIPRTT